MKIDGTSFHRWNLRGKLTKFLGNCRNSMKDRWKSMKIYGNPWSSTVNRVSMIDTRGASIPRLRIWEPRPSPPRLKRSIDSDRPARGSRRSNGRFEDRKWARCFGGSLMDARPTEQPPRTPIGRPLTDIRLGRLRGSIFRKLFFGSFDRKFDREVW